MDLQHFEQAILKLAFETDARITTAAVAYYLGIPSREANRLLNALLEEGVLELDSDSSGNLFYRIPHHSNDGDGSVVGAIQELRAKKEAAEQPREQSSAPRPRVSAAHFNASPDDMSSGGQSAYSPVIAGTVGRVDGANGAATPGPAPWGVHPNPTHQGPSHQGPSHQGPTHHGPTQGWQARSGPNTPALPAGSDGGTGRSRGRDSWGGFDDYFDPGAGLDGSPSGQRIGMKPRQTWNTAASRIASPDASLDRCGSSAVVVSTQVRCEPRPLPAEKPMIVSCADSAPAVVDKGREQMWFGRPAESTALVEVGETALAREYYIEQPEHQPGMALLLSLILCGTGQIYNGEVSKGIMMMILCFLLWFVLLGWVVHIWSIVDAVVVAERLNRKQA